MRSSTRHRPPPPRRRADLPAAVGTGPGHGAEQEPGRPLPELRPSSPRNYARRWPSGPVNPGATAIALIPPARPGCPGRRSCIPQPSDQIEFRQRRTFERRQVGNGGFRTIEVGQRRSLQRRQVGNSRAMKVQRRQGHSLQRRQIRNQRTLEVQGRQFQIPQGRQVGQSALGPAVAADR